MNGWMMDRQTDGGTDKRTQNETPQGSSPCWRRHVHQPTSETSYWLCCPVGGLSLTHTYTHAYMCVRTHTHTHSVLYCCINNMSSRLNTFLLQMNTNKMDVHTHTHIQTSEHGCINTCRNTAGRLGWRCCSGRLADHCWKRRYVTHSHSEGLSSPLQSIPVNGVNHWFHLLALIFRVTLFTSPTASTCKFTLLLLTSAPFDSPQKKKKKKSTSSRSLL